MKITVTSPWAKKELTASWVEITTSKGNRIVKNGHAPFIAKLSNEHLVLFERDPQELEYIAGQIKINNGFIQVMPDAIQILADEFTFL